MARTEIMYMFMQMYSSLKWLVFLVSNRLHHCVVCYKVSDQHRHKLLTAHAYRLTHRQVSWRWCPPCPVEYRIQYWRKKNHSPQMLMRGRPFGVSLDPGAQHYFCILGQLSFSSSVNPSTPNPHNPPFEATKYIWCTNINVTLTSQSTPSNLLFFTFAV